MIKSEARLLAKKILNEISLENKVIQNENIYKQIINNNYYINARIVAIYYPNQFEVDLLKLLEDKNKTFVFPKINKLNLLEFVGFDNETIWETNKFNIKEPLNGKIIKEGIDLILIPMLAKNINNYRLGYGGGYFDKFLETKNIYKIGIIYNNLTINFQEEIHDVKLDEIISYKE